jgi:hypothetical protein|tara:strand:+ start:23950 stop:24183 length:234 start_codon:yes stop_codon:yes gene_type:complete
MSQISKKKLIKVLKGDIEVQPTRESLLDRMAKPVTQEEWLKGYHKWVQDQTLSTPLSEYEAIENIGKKHRKKTNVND